MSSRKLTLRGPTREELAELRSGPRGSSTLASSTFDRKKCSTGGDAECKFCGVSYLVRSQVRDLHEQLREAHEEIEKRAAELEQAQDNNSNRHDTNAACPESRDDLSSCPEMMTRDAFMRGIACEKAKAQIEYENQLTNQIRRHNAELAALRKESSVGLKGERAAALQKLRSSTAQVEKLKTECAGLKAMVFRQTSICKVQLGEAAKTLLAQHKAAVAAQSAEVSERLRIAESSSAAGQLELEAGRRELEDIKLALATEEAQVANHRTENSTRA
jgi:hypothetical protein